LPAVNLTAVQVTKLPLCRKIRKIEVIRFPKSGLTEDFNIEQKEDVLITLYTLCAICTLEKGQAYS
jgi:hypothetical protein